jgi:hypothetical protein
MTSVYRRAVEFLLAAVHTHVGEDGMRNAFLFGKPGAPPWQRNMGVEIFVSLKHSIIAALFVREHGAPYLRALSISDICGLLTNFLTENYYEVANETFFQRFPESFGERVSGATKDKLAASLAVSPLFKPEVYPTLFPLVAVHVEADFSSPPFFLRQPATLLTEFKSEMHKWLVPESFPPLSVWKDRIEKPASWLGVRSPALQASQKMKAAILGAVALTPSLSYRHMFSQRTMFGGWCTINGGSQMAFGTPATPPMMENIVITAADHAWLGLLAAKLASPSKADRRQLTALEYFYRAWPLGPAERFPVLCMALDAAFSEASRATQSIVDGVRGTLGDHVDEKRLRDLMEIRASVIHGGAPDVYDSRKYGRYYSAYSEDPIADLGLVVSACLRQRIFGDALTEHGEPYQDIIAKAQATGRMPKAFKTSSILTPSPPPAG